MTTQSTLNSIGWRFPRALRNESLPEVNFPATVDNRSDTYVRPVDAAKEAKREQLRTVFSHEKWMRHRSTSRYYRHFATFYSSSILQALLTPLVMMTAYSTGLATYETLREMDTIPSTWPSLSLHNQHPFAVGSFAIALLLVFRTTESYQRWLEARRIWGGVVNRSRDIVRQAFTYFDPRDAVLRAAFARWTTALCFSLKGHLRNKNDLHADLKDVLLPEELKVLLEEKHGPNFVQSMMSEIVFKSNLPHLQMHLLDNNITFFADAVGSCERILKTPIPLSYTRHTSRFLLVWLAFLPFTLWDSCRWGSVPIAVVVTFFMLGIDEIGVTIEEPFSILALDAICETIKNDLRQLADRQSWARGFLSRQLDGRDPVPTSSGPPQRESFDSCLDVATRGRTLSFGIPLDRRLLHAVPCTMGVATASNGPHKRRVSVDCLPQKRWRAIGLLPV